GLSRMQQAAHGLFARKHLQWGAAIRIPLPRREAKRVPSPEKDAPNPVRAPPLAAEPKAELARPSVLKPDRHRVLPLEESRLTRKLDEDVEPVSADLGIEPDDDLDVFTLEHALALDARVHVDLRPPREQARHRRQDREWRG